MYMCRAFGVTVSLARPSREQTRRRFAELEAKIAALWPLLHTMAIMPASGTTPALAHLSELDARCGIKRYKTAPLTAQRRYYVAQQAVYRHGDTDVRSGCVVAEAIGHAFALNPEGCGCAPAIADAQSGTREQ
ncbi:MAG TPA: hypothetical protein VKJ47_07365 [Candidatus Binatia bacterium]|nr:hypothetical protein [Candidatus Binatia bacterium]